MTVPDDVVQRLRSGDERAFRSVVKQLHRSMIGVAMGLVDNRATADEVVQDTWLAVIEGLDSFEQRSSLKTWIFAILVNKARSRAVRDGKTTTVGDFSERADDDQPVVDPSRFDSSGSWTSLPRDWNEPSPERIVGGRQMLEHARDAIQRLAPGQRAVLILREIEGMEPSEVNALLGITDANQRVLLHRARARIREFMEDVLGK